MKRRFMMLVLTVMLIVTMSPALAVVEGFPKMGTPLPRTVCEVLADDSTLVGQRNGERWVFHPVSVVGFYALILLLNRARS